MEYKYNERDMRDMTPKKVYVTWDDVEDFISELTSFILQKTDEGKSFSGVYGPARGGVLFAVILSNRLGLSYLGAPQKDCLVVDDIVDTGATAEAWKAKGYTIASMYYSDTSTVTPDFWWKKKEGKWVIFPWEAQIH
jgi:hypoxanthine phosphoribosyltransferase